MDAWLATGRCCVPGDQGIPVTPIQRALESAGVEFIDGGVKQKETVDG